MIAVEFQQVSKRYRRQSVLSGLDLTVEAGTFTVVYGPPACGKSVLVRLLMGLEQPDSGRVLLRGADANGLSPGLRNIGYIPQSFALYPHLSVFDNIAYPLRLMHRPKADIQRAVQEAADLLRIAHLLQKRPDQCSGGEKQRIAIARGIVKHTEIFVLDDPLVGLDFKLREQLVDDLRQMQESLRATFVYTTSDAGEGLLLAERIAVLDGGRIVESGALGAVYDAPQHARTMELLAFPRPALLRGQLQSRDGASWCTTPLFAFPVRLQSTAAESEVLVALRPQHVALGGEGDGRLTHPVRVTLREDLGGEEIVYLDAGGQELVTVLRHDQHDLLTGDLLVASVRPEDLVVYARDSGRRLGEGAVISRV